MGGGSAQDFIIQLFPFIALFAIMYFLVLRPQQRRVKAHRELVANVRRGDVVVTAGGLIGKELADNVRVRIIKSTLTEVRSKSEPVPANANTPS